MKSKDKMLEKIKEHWLDVHFFRTYRKLVKSFDEAEIKIESNGNEVLIKYQMNGQVFDTVKRELKSESENKESNELA